MTGFLKQNCTEEPVNQNRPCLSAVCLSVSNFLSVCLRLFLSLSVCANQAIIAISYLSVTDAEHRRIVICGNDLTL